MLMALLFCGCGARTEVIKEKVLKKIDSLLGETEVQKKEVEMAMKDMDKAIDELAKGRVGAKVKAERLESEAKETEQRIEDADNSLRKLREYLTSTTPVVIAGKPHTPQQVKGMADKVLEARKTLSTQLESLKQSQARLEKVVGDLEARESSAKARLVKLKGRLKEMDADLVSLKTMRDTAALAGDEDKTLAGSFEELEKKVTALQDKVKSETRWQEEKWKAQDTKREVESVDAIIAATKDSKDTVAEIDKVLGKK
jgi:peptidoglycan hydrolase CwlO-like protein